MYNALKDGKRLDFSLEQHITIDLFGQRYRFKAEDGLVDPQSVADFLMAEVHKLEGGQTDHAVDTNRTVILLQAALNICNEHLKLKQQLAAVSGRLFLKTERLQGALNRSAAFPPGSGVVAG